MPRCIVLYKVIVGTQPRIVIAHLNEQILVVNSGVMQLVREMELDMERLSSESPASLMALAANSIYMQASVIFTGEDPIQSLLDWKILTPNYQLVELTFLKEGKFRGALCEGENAMSYWERGRKPKLPAVIKELYKDVSNYSGQAEVPNPLPLQPELPASPAPEQVSGEGVGPEDGAGQGSPAAEVSDPSERY